MRRGAWAALVVVALGLTGCSDPGTPSDTLPTAASTSAEPTLEPLGPADFPVPDEAREQTLDGALAMNTYYFDLLNYSQRIPTGDWLRQIAEQCAVCTSTADYFDRSAAAGVIFEGGEFIVLSSTGEVSGETSATTAVRVQFSAVTATGPGGQDLPAEANAAAIYSGGLTLRWDSALSAWLVTQLDLSEG